MRATTVLCACAVAAALAPLAAYAGSGKPGLGCPPGFDLGSKSLQEYLQLARTQDAITAGLVSAADIAASFSSADRNGNGYLCVQLSAGLEVSSRPYGQYLYNVADDNASVPSET